MKLRYLNRLLIFGEAYLGTMSDEPTNTGGIPDTKQTMNKSQDISLIEKP